MSVLTEQFKRVVQLGWLPYFEEAAKLHGLDVPLLMAIGSRETNLRNIVGDGGHGYGVMQIDNRSFPEFIRKGTWKQAKYAILYGSEVLKTKYAILDASIGKRLSVKGHNYIGLPLKSAHDRDAVAVAAYNCGDWSYYCYSKGIDVDTYTTHHDYSKDVLSKRAAFGELYASHLKGSHHA